ncbi:hypothetical protein [Erwinia mallotivora]|uniref:hypothetical protein n=1 Tax=Erwinia mallotivora TaxID=69222 RepID=UPI0021C1C7F7|nr:hypothetical protein [Erwinia mallotivora]
MTVSKGYDRYKPSKATKISSLLMIFILIALCWFFLKRVNYFFTDNWSYITVGGLEKIEEQKGYFGNKSVIYTNKGDRITVNGTYSDYHQYINEKGLAVVLKRSTSDKYNLTDGNNLWCISNECHFQADASTTVFHLNKD